MRGELAQLGGGEIVLTESDQREDALAGIASGKSSGARVIAFTTTASITDLVAAKPDWILKDGSAIRLEAFKPELKLALEEITATAR